MLINALLFILGRLGRSPISGLVQRIGELLLILASDDLPAPRYRLRRRQVQCFSVAAM